MLVSTAPFFCTIFHVDIYWHIACFLGALQLVGSRAGKKEIVDKAKVHATVFLGHPSDANLEGFGIRAEITVEGCNDDALIQAAHDVWFLILAFFSLVSDFCCSSAHIAAL